MCTSRRKSKKKRPVITPAPIIFNDAPDAPDRPDTPDPVKLESGSGEAFKPGKKKKKDRSLASRGTGSLRIPRTSVNTPGAGGGGVNV